MINHNWDIGNVQVTFPEVVYNLLTTIYMLGILQLSTSCKLYSLVAEGIACLRI